MKINDLISGVAGVSIDEDGVWLKTAPQIQIPNAKGYTTRYYVSDAWKDLGNDDWVQVPGWCDDDGLIAEDEITPGVAVWVKSVGADAIVNVAGAVLDDDNVQVSCPAAFALRANVFPVPTTLNDSGMVVSGIASVDIDEEGAWLKTAPQIQIPNAKGYTTRYYVKDAWKDLGNDDWVQVPGWCDDDGLIAEDVIPVAQGFWTKGVGSAFTITFSK